MPKIRPGMRKPPADFSVVCDALDDFERQMKDAVCATDGVKKKHEVTWDVAKLNFAKTRHVFECYTKRRISAECLQYCCDMHFVDAGLVKKWKLSGYETLCCVKCVQSSNFSTGAAACVCRVPHRRHSQPCSICGCSGCASGKKVSTSDRGVAEMASTAPAAVNTAAD